MSKKILSIGLVLFSTVSLLAETEKTLLITGTAKVGIAAELVEIRIGVETEAKTADEAHEKTAKKTESLVKYLKSQNLLSLQTEAIELHPIYDYSKTSQRQIKAYLATNSIVLRSKVEQSGKLIDEAVQSGANQILGIRLLPSDSNSEKATLEALQLAAKDAKKKAENVLSSLGLKLKDFVEIRAESQSEPEPVRGYTAGVTLGKQTSPIEGGTIFREARVTLKISY